MNLHHIINEIESFDPEVHERLNDRRSALKKFSSFAGKVALLSVPVALGQMFQKSYGQSTSSVIDVLNFALKLEYLESEFYTRAVATSGLIPAGAATGAITTIRDHENAHVAFLKSAISSAGGTPVAKPTFDFSAGSGSGNGPFKNVFSDYALFLAVAQTFEDTGVRAYKGQAGNLISNSAVLTAALNIHSVEARHASHVRSMRRSAGANVKSWITLNDTGGIGTAVQASYNGEENTTQAGVQITNIGGNNISASAASEAFDEPLTMAQVLAIVGPFFA